MILFLLLLLLASPAHAGETICQLPGGVTLQNTDHFEISRSCSSSRQVQASDIKTYIYGSTPGSNGQILFNSNGNTSGFTPSGDVVVNLSSGALTVNKTGGILFASSATIDTTNAANITSGVLYVSNGGTGASAIGCSLTNANGTLNVTDCLPRGGYYPTDTVTAADSGKTIDYYAASSLSFPSASAAGTTFGFAVMVVNHSTTASLSVTASGSQFIDIASNASLTIPPATRCLVSSDSTNYRINCTPLIPVGLIANGALAFNSNGHWATATPGSGLSFNSVTGLLSSSTPPGGSSGQFQYNSNGALAGGSFGSGLTFNSVTGLLTAAAPVNTTYRYVGAGFGGTGTTPTQGILGWSVTVPYAGTITGWHISSDLTGSATIDVWKRNNAVPTVANSITASSPITLNSSTFRYSSALTGWATAVSPGDTFLFYLSTASGLTKGTAQLDITTN